MPGIPATAVGNDFSSFHQPIPDTELSIEMVPIAGGLFSMGSPTDEPGRKADEGPQH